MRLIDTEGADVAEEQGIGVGELSRQVRDVLVRMEGLAARLESQFIRTDNFALYKQLVDTAISQLQQAVAKLPPAEVVTQLSKDMEDTVSKGTHAALVKRVEDLEDDKKWLIRLVLGFIVLGVLGAVFAVTKASGS